MTDQPTHTNSLLHVYYTMFEYFPRRMNHTLFESNSTVQWANLNKFCDLSILIRPRIGIVLLRLAVRAPFYQSHNGIYKKDKRWVIIYLP